MAEERREVIAIDLGCSNIFFGFVKPNRQGKIIECINDHGGNITKNCVSFKQNGEIIIGKQCNTYDPTVVGINYLLGARRGDQAIAEFQKVCKVPLVFVDDKPRISIPYDAHGRVAKDYTPEEVLTLIFQYIKKCAWNETGNSSLDCVIAVPSHFTSKQKDVIKIASINAGIPCIRIITQATAIAFHFQKENNLVAGNAFILDIGASKTNATIAIFDTNELIIKASCEDSTIGGNYIDNLIEEEMIGRFRLMHPNENPETDPFAMMQLKNECITAKNILSCTMSSNINIPSFYNGYDLNERITKIQLERMYYNMLEKIDNLISRCLETAYMSEDDIRFLMIEGGSSINSVIKNEVIDRFNQRTTQLNSNEPEGVVFLGTAQIYNAQEEDRQFHISEVISKSIGIIGDNGNIDVIFQRGMSLPCTSSSDFIVSSDEERYFIISVFQYNEEEHNESQQMYENIEIFTFDIPSGTRIGTIVHFDMMIDEYGDFSITGKIGDIILEKHKN